MNSRIALVICLPWLMAFTLFGGNGHAQGRPATEQELEQAIRSLIDDRLDAGNGHVVVSAGMARDGQVKRLSIAVLVRDTIPPTTISELSVAVRQAAGVDTGRGDTLEVVSMPFVDPREESDGGLLDRLEIAGRRMLLDRLESDQENRLAAEQSTARRLEKLLEPVVGQGGVKVAVSTILTTGDHNPRRSTAVLVDGIHHVDAATGYLRYETRSQDEMESLATLLRAAVGFDADRGDTVHLINVQFADPLSSRALVAQQLRHRYERYLRDKVLAVLEPAAGQGNVQAMVSAPLYGRGKDARITAVVYVGGSWIYGAESQQPEYVPLPPELKELYAILVRSAVGYDAARDDRVEIVDLPSPRPE